jgi:hypothetical protein
MWSTTGAAGAAALWTMTSRSRAPTTSACWCWKMLSDSFASCSCSSVSCRKPCKAVPVCQRWRTQPLSSPGQLRVGNLHTAQYPRDHTFPSQPGGRAALLECKVLLGSHSAHNLVLEARDGARRGPDAIMQRCQSRKPRPGTLAATSMAASMCTSTWVGHERSVVLGIADAHDCFTCGKAACVCGCSQCGGRAPGGPGGHWHWAGAHDDGAQPSPLEALQAVLQRRQAAEPR